MLTDELQSVIYKNVADALAELHGMSRDEIAAQCEANALQLFARVS